MNYKTRKASEKDKEFQSIIKELIKNKQVQEMKKYKHHFSVSCYEHCYDAAYRCYKICKKHKLDYKSATRATMLHDMFLYDWHKKQEEQKRFLDFHAFSHPKIAYKNASKEFKLNEKEKDIILKHMWPVTISLPRSKEATILVIVDKHCVITETIEELKNKIIKRKKPNKGF